MAGTFTKLLYHIVFSTKHRRPLILPSLREQLYPYIGGIVRADQGVLLRIGGMPDHVHLVTRFKADVSVATMVRLIKTNSSKWVHEAHGQGMEFGWQTGYGAFTVSASRLAAVQDYVRRQEQHHRRRTFQEEFVGMLKRHGVEYEERYLWD